jgi:hypothetical protein
MKEENDSASSATTLNLKERIIVQRAINAF